jgi:hypothetical protein
MSFINDCLFEKTKISLEILKIDLVIEKGGKVEKATRSDVITANIVPYDSEIDGKYGEGVKEIVNVISVDGCLDYYGVGDYVKYKDRLYEIGQFEKIDSPDGSGSIFNIICGINDE